MLLFPTFLFTQVAAGPLNSFAASPIPYWDDDSSGGIDITWDSTEQTVTLDYEPDDDYEDATYWSESFADVSDWTVDAGAISTDGDVADHELDAWEIIEHDGLVFTSSEGYYLTLRAKANKTLTGSIFITKADAGGGGPVVNNQAYVITPVWQTFRWLISDMTGYSAGVMECLQFTSATANAEINYDWVHIGLPEVDLGIPLLEQDAQQVALYMDTTHLDSEITLELYADTTASGTSCTVNDTHVTFKSEGFLGTTAQTDGWSRIVFNNYQEDATSEIIVSDNSSVIEDIWMNSYTFTGVNWFRLSDPVFEGNLTLLYINGDTNYTTFYADSDWTQTGTQNESVYQHLYGFDYEADGTTFTHDSNYSTTFPYTQYLRTEWTFFTQGNVFSPLVKQKQAILIEMNYDNGSTQFEVYWELSTFSNVTDNYASHIWWFREYLAGSPTDLIRTDYVEAVSATDYTITAKTMFWRTQEDHVGVMVWDSEGSWSMWGNNETIFVTENIPDSWTCDITLIYELDSTATNSDAFCEFDYFEYEYWIDEGVAQPHFSSTFWDNTGRAWHIGSQYDEANGGVLATWNSWEEIPVNNTVVDPPRQKTLLEQFFDTLYMIGTFFAAGISVVANIAWDGIVTAVVAGVNILVGVFEFVGNTIASGAGTGLVNTISGIVAIIGSLFSLIIMFFGWLGAFVDIISGALTWATTFLFTTNMFLLIGGAMILLPVLALGGTNIMNKGTGYQGAVAWLLVYAGLGIMVLSLAWRLVSGILNLISGFIPLT